MSVIQREIDKSDYPGMYRMSLIGPPGKGRFERSKHIDMSHDDGAARTMNLINEGELHEMKDAYIGELHSQIVTMIEMVTNSHRAVVNENREMMKIVSEAVRKNGELEQARLLHQLKVREMEDDARFKEMEIEQRSKNIQDGIAVFKESGAVDEILKAVARQIDKFGRKDEAKEEQTLPVPVSGIKPPSEELDEDDEEEVEEETKVTKKKSTRKKASKKKPAKKSTKKKAKRKTSKKKTMRRKSDVEAASEAEVDDEEDEIDEELMEEGRKMVRERPLVMAAEALKMSIDANSQWSVIRKTLTEEQADILDDIIASTTDAQVLENAQLLYDAPGTMKLMELSNHLDEQQQKFIGFILSHIKK
jgi:hypothetical protein